jgi:hypothetical protein
VRSADLRLLTAPSLILSKSTRLLALALLACFVSACGDVQHCERGASGCLAGPPATGATECSFGLVLINGACAEPGAKPPALSCNCEDGQVCTADAYECVDYCAPLDVEIGTAPAPEPISCAPSLGFDALCEHRCLLRCRQWRDLCSDSAGCSPEACRSSAERSACHDECASESDAARCMAQHCSDTLAAGCKEVVCPQQKRPSCDQVQCRNSCPRYNFDGICDDGELKSAASGACAFGTDCADCGPRRGAAPKPLAQGSACAFHSNCAGSHPEDLAAALSWCIEIADDISRCAPDCSDEGEICPEGSACFELSGVDQDDDGKPDALVAGERRASACFPVACE